MRDFYMSTTETLIRKQESPLITPTDLRPQATRDVAGAMNAILADVFALYLKTKNFHWHMSGPHFRDYHLPLDEHAEQLLAMIDPIAERIRKLGGLTLNPPRTHWIRDAETRGCRVMDGLAMLVNQGVIGIKYWTGVDADVTVMRKALEKALSL